MKTGGVYSLIQSESNGRINVANGRSSIAFGHSNTTYQRDTFAIGGGNTAGDSSGDADATICCGALGVQNIVKGTGSLTVGQANNISTKWSCAIGESNIITGSSSFAVGNSNKARQASSYAFGQHNEVDGWLGFAFGYGNKAPQALSVAFGQGNETKRTGAVVVGNYAANSNFDLFTVGNGSDADHRSWALRVFNDGRVKASGAPVESNDVIRKQELDTATTVATMEEINQIFN